MNHTDEFYIKYINDTNFLKDVTKKMYISKIKSIITNITPDYNIHTLLQNPEQFDSKLTEYLTTQKGRIADTLGIHAIESFYTSIIALFLYNQKLREDNYDLFQRWKYLQSKYKDKIDAKYKSNEPTNRQKLAYIPFDEIVSIRDNLPIGSIEKLLIMMYTEVPPVRSDYYRTEIISKLPNKFDEEQNYIIINPTQAMIILEKHKTSKKYGTIFIDIPDILKNEIKLSLKNQPRKYLFTMYDDVPYEKENTFNKWANKTLKKIFNNESFTLTMFRHIYISRRDLKLETKSGLQQDEIAKQMGHSIDRQKRYMWHTWLEGDNNLLNN